MLPLQEYRAWFDKHRNQIFNDFSSFLSFPSISTDPRHAKEVRSCATWLCDYLKKIGMQVQLWETSVHPVVFAEAKASSENRPTVLIYNHYDVQPVDPLPLWESDPFQPVFKEGKVYARGASDNKGQCFYVVTALKAYLERAKERDLNIKFLIEGEEECGSKGTFEILEKKQKELAADHLIVVDFGLIDEATPTLSLGMRGLLALEMTCRNSAIDLHSGCHGGLVLNPLRALTQALSGLWDSQGRVAVPGFYDAILPLSEQEHARLCFDFDEEGYRKDFGVREFAFEPGFGPWESNWLRPSLEINGISGGYAGEGFKTVLPAEAHAKLSCRTVPGQDPDELADRIATFLRSKMAKGLEVTIKKHHTAPSYRGSTQNLAVRLAAKAYEEVFGKACAYILCGATVPVVPKLSQAAGCEPVMMGMALNTDDIHAPNEHFRLKCFENGFLTMSRLLDLLERREHC